MGHYYPILQMKVPVLVGDRNRVITDDALIRRIPSYKSGHPPMSLSSVSYFQPRLQCFLSVQGDCHLGVGTPGAPEAGTDQRTSTGAPWPLWQGRFQMWAPCTAKCLRGWAPHALCYGKLHPALCIQYGPLGIFSRASRGLGDMPGREG